MCKFAGNDLDETTLRHFRYLPESSNLGCAMLEGIKHCMDIVGLIMRSGTIVGATIINASSSTNNAGHALDPEMH